MGHKQKAFGFLEGFLFVGSIDPGTRRQSVAAISLFDAQPTGNL
jgi:hypothetical protein